MIKSAQGGSAINGDTPSSSKYSLIYVYCLAETVQWSCDKKCSVRDFSCADRQRAHMTGASSSVKGFLCKVLQRDK